MSPIKICPIYGSKKIKRLTRTLMRVFTNTRYEMPDVAYDECIRRSA